MKLTHLFKEVVFYTNTIIQERNRRYIVCMKLSEDSSIIKRLIADIPKRFNLDQKSLSKGLKYRMNILNTPCEDIKEGYKYDCV